MSGRLHSRGDISQIVYGAFGKQERAFHHAAVQPRRVQGGRVQQPLGGFQRRLVPTAALDGLSLDPPANSGRPLPVRFLHEEFWEVNPGVDFLPLACSAACPGS